MYCLIAATECDSKVETQAAGTVNSNISGSDKHSSDSPDRSNSCSLGSNKRSGSIRCVVEETVRRLNFKRCNGSREVAVGKVRTDSCSKYEIALSKFISFSMIIYIKPFINMMHLITPLIIFMVFN